MTTAPNVITLMRWEEGAERRSKFCEQLRQQYMACVVSPYSLCAASAYFQQKLMQCTAADAPPRK